MARNCAYNLDMKKDEKLKTSIMRMVIHLDCTKGHLRWSINDIARAAKVSRSLVYYYFGKTKSEILLNCLSDAVNEFYGLISTTREVSVISALIRTYTIYKQNPDYAVFFQKWRHKPSDVQKILLDAEMRFEQKLRSQFQLASEDQIKGLHALFHGLATAPYLEESSLRAAFSLIDLASLEN